MITFDMYSALLDIEGSGVPQVEKILGLPHETCRDFFKLWRSRQWDYVLLSSVMQKGFLPYEEITAKALEHTQKKFEMVIGDGEKKALMDIWLHFKPWPEAKETVDAIKAKGYKVAMLSNGDAHMLRSLEASTGIVFDFIFSADQAQCYKPHPDIYALPSKQTGIPPDAFLHVAGSLFDMMGAKAAGLQCAWSNRFGDYTIDTRFEPDYETRDLKQLLDYL